MNKALVLLLPTLVLLVTGCPRNDYTVELKPQGDKIQRELVFYRADGTNGNGVPKYESFPQEELDGITAVYPRGGVTSDEGIPTAKGEFSGAMPVDVGGAGTYTNLVTGMGSAGFYGERFRGNDDLAGRAEKRLARANQLTDLLIGWSEVQLGKETNYAALHKFLDVEFRKDFKNAVFYWSQALVENSPETNTAEVYTVRFAQYLMERGYFKLSDAPALFLAMGDNDGHRFMSFVQRLVARKLGENDAQPIPASLAFLHDSDAMKKSFTNYFIGTELYRDKVSEWQKKHEPPDQKPDIGEIMAEEFGNLFEINLFGDPADHLTVKLYLPEPPAHTNGRWDETNKLVLWDSDIELKTNSMRLPVLCYASWDRPNGEFQKQHFGRIILVGDDLMEYCIWQASLTEKQGAEWEKLLAGLQPGDALKQKVKTLHLSDEPPAVEQKEKEKSPSYLGQASLENALEGKSLRGQPSDASKLN